MTTFESAIRLSPSAHSRTLSPGSGSKTSSHLRPEDAILPAPLAKSSRQSSPLGRHDSDVPIDTAGYNTLGTRRRRDGRRGRSTHKRTKEKWKKLLWVKQAYPDNYTDEETFLDQLKRNPRLRPYDFWSLVSDSTIIVQHVASVMLFICCFTAIFQERISPVLMVTWTTAGTILGWIVRDYWVAQSQSTDHNILTPPMNRPPDSLGISNHASPVIGSNSTGSADQGTSVPPGWPASAPDMPLSGDSPHAAGDLGRQYTLSYGGRPSRLSARNRERLATIKSAILIYAALLGLSPILKSLTKSTSPDSIWAISSWLIIINVFTFDYGAGVEAKFPASLSTNAALMASTVLASRLPSTKHVFSITLFSIEIFGLFPVFRRHLRHNSYRGHLLLTLCLVVSAGGGLGVTITGGGWRAAVVGVMLGMLVTSLIMGMTSWWLIGLQRYKNEIRGPWDPARPIIRRHWD